MSLLVFQIEAEVNTHEDKIKQFFSRRNFIIKAIKLKDLESKTIVSYTVTMDFCSDLISGLQAIIDCEVDMKEGLNIKLKKAEDEKTNYTEKFLKNLEEEKNKKLIIYKEDYENNVKINFIKQTGEAGIEWINQEEIKKQRSIISYLVSKVGKNILSGKLIMDVSLPIYIFDERSLLETMALGMTLFPYFPSYEFKDIVERMKQAVTSCLSTLHLSVSMTKPFNPILGETFQCKVRDCLMYMEQTSHHPPVYNFYYKHTMFISFGYISMETSTGTNTLTILQMGKMFVKYSDGTVYNYTLPPFILNGLTMGKRLVNFKDNIVITDLTNNLIACVNMNPDERGLFGKLFTKRANFPDYYIGFIANIRNVKFDAKKNCYTCDKSLILAKIEGEWTNFVKIDDKLRWEHGMYPLFPMEKQAFTLPSDSLCREDLILLKLGDHELAQQAKTNLEEIQRNDKKLREKYRKIF